MAVPYTSPDTLFRVATKLYDATPSDLPETLKSSIVQVLSCNPSSMEAAIKAGCVLLTMQARVPRGNLPDALSIAEGLLHSDACWQTRPWVVRASGTLVNGPLLMRARCIL